MLNTHPEMFNGDYEVEFPLDENQIVKRFDYGDIPVRNSKHLVCSIRFAAYHMSLLALYYQLTILDNEKSLDECQSSNVFKSQLGRFSDRSYAHGISSFY